MTSITNGSAAKNEPQAQISIETAIEHAKRAFALRKYEQAIDHYATALELMTQKCGEDAPESADLYFLYGKALLENAIVQSSVLGKEQPEDDAHDEQKASGSGVGATGPILSFSGDAEDEAVDLFNQATHLEEDESDQEEEGEDGEPEDDFNAAWEVLDLARAIYDKQNQEDDDEEVKLKLADTYIALGDVSLETEKFDQAITDYEAGLKLKVQLLPTSSRQIAEAHYKLSMVLDLTSGRLADAIIHVEKALESVEMRIAELRNGSSGQSLATVPAKDVKGKGKSGTRLVRDDLVQNMSKIQIDNEIKELSGLRDDLSLKVEELKTSPTESLLSSAPALAAQALDRELNGSASAIAVTAPVVNDLTSMVVKKKKKKAPEDTSAALKRKVETEVQESSLEKKARLDTPES